MTITTGIIQVDSGFAIKDFYTGKVLYPLRPIRYSSYDEAADMCRGWYYPEENFKYLQQAGKLAGNINADTWENMVYAGDPRGVWDNEKEEWRDISTMDRGAATEYEIAYIDALDATYHSLCAIVGAQ